MIETPNLPELWNIHFVVRNQKQVHMQNFSQIGEVPWPTLTQIL